MAVSTAASLFSFLLLLLPLALPVNGDGLSLLEIWQKNLLAQASKNHSVDTSVWDSALYEDSAGLSTGSPVCAAAQQGLMEADKIVKLPGQPEGVDFSQYSGYVTVDPKAGRAFFYYFVESAETSASQKPLVLWLNGGPGCSSIGRGAMTELGPFRVDKDGKTLQRNAYSWNKLANIIFLESPAGVGFSYSITTSDYRENGDKRTAKDSHAFLVNWLERFPHYKGRDFYIAGESYAGHYVPQLAYEILRNNKNCNRAVINLRGIAIGNGLLDDEARWRGTVDYLWMHTLISDEIHSDITSTCNFSAGAVTRACSDYVQKAFNSIGNIFVYDIYAPLCNDSSLVTPTISGFDPCSISYVITYLNSPVAQRALHARPTIWERCNNGVRIHWRDWASSVLPVMNHLLSSGIRTWIYSGDTDAIAPVTSTKYAIEKLNLSVGAPWYPWYSQGEVGGFAVGYKGGLTFATVRGSGHYVPSYQPARALTLFSSFLEGTLPPTAQGYSSTIV